MFHDPQIKVMRPVSVNGVLTDGTCVKRGLRSFKFKVVQIIISVITLSIIKQFFLFEVLFIRSIDRYVINKL